MKKQRILTMALAGILSLGVVAPIINQDNIVYASQVAQEDRTGTVLNVNMAANIRELPNSDAKMATSLVSTTPLLSKSAVRSPIAYAALKISRSSPSTSPSGSKSPLHTVAAFTVYQNPGSRL